jgi:pilus assembly protein Flp/PilA
VFNEGIVLPRKDHRGIRKGERTHTNRYLNGRKKVQHEQLYAGQGLIEYAMIIVLIAVVVMLILITLGPAIGNIYSTIVASI